MFQHTKTFLFQIASATCRACVDMVSSSPTLSPVIGRFLALPKHVTAKLQRHVPSYQIYKIHPGGRCASFSVQLYQSHRNKVAE